MKYFQSQIEKLLYVLVMCVVLANVIILLVLINNTAKINAIISNHSKTLAAEAAATKTVESNQYANSTTLESFIRNGLVCTAVNPLPPTATPAQITAEGLKCFPNSPAIK